MSDPQPIPNNDYKQQEIDRLTELNRKLANQIVNMTDKLEETRRELLATGWDACAEKVADMRFDGAPLLSHLQAANPYRKPIDL